MARSSAKTKKERIAEEVAKAVNAGKVVAVETVDFSDPNRPKTCLEVDFPIIPINQIAIIEGNAGKPIYQMSKWWARRRSSVFRAMLLAAAMKAPDDPAEAAKAVWDVYYANHQKKGALKDLKVADIFMGGGTTIVEGSRLGMQMYGNDLNPVAWFVVKNEMAQVDPDEVKALLDDIEAEVKPQIMPFYACDCPRGHKGKWTKLSTNEVMGVDFDPLSLTPDERKDYNYEGPEIIYVFWAKHGPCQVTGCGHRTPIMSSPVMAVKTLTVKAWEYNCQKCEKGFDVEEGDARMAPGVPLFIAETEKPFAVIDSTSSITCPFCHHHTAFTAMTGKQKNKERNKKIELSLLVHPQWLAGSPKLDPDGQEYGGSATDSPEATAAWNKERASKLRLLEVRGALPEMVTCPEMGVSFRTDLSTDKGRGIFNCGFCGKEQEFVDSVEKTKKTSPVSILAVQGICVACEKMGIPYGGRFFALMTNTRIFDSANIEWENRKDSDLHKYWPRSPLPFGHMTHQRQPLPQHGYLYWSSMFNTRQLLIHSQLLWAIIQISKERHKWEVREFVLGVFQQYLRNQSLFTLWNIQADKLEPMFANNNYHPKTTLIENGVFADRGRGNWRSCTESLFETLDWSTNPWETVSKTYMEDRFPNIAEGISGKSEKVVCNDPVENNSVKLECGSATDLKNVSASSKDLVITDPPFGGLLHYSELADFFYVYLRLVLKERYPEYFTDDYTPKTLEAVSNKARNPEDPDGFYQRLLTQSWREANRILKPGGILAFTFHHSEDAPWVAVLESLFEAGFYLEATYPIRSDETKGEGEFGSKTIEYDIIHVCRKRIENPSMVSWARMRRAILQDVRQIQKLLEHHQQEGLPSADMQVIKRGKALEYFSRHYGAVYVDEDKTISVKDALLGINQLLDEESGSKEEPPPAIAEPFTRQFMRIFYRKTEVPRDQMQKYLRGTGSAPSEFEERGWCKEKSKIYHLISPLDIARSWGGKHRQKMTSDYDQAMFLIGACFDQSGINAKETLLNNENFKPHPALGLLLDWFGNHGANSQIMNAAIRAGQIYRAWQSQNKPKVQQQEAFFFMEEEA